MSKNIIPNNGSVNFSDDKRVSVGSGMVAGFIASFFSSVVLAFLTYIVAVPEFNYLAIQSSIFGIAANAILYSWIVYFAIGTLIWGLLYALLEPYLNGTAMVKGLTYGLIVWLIIMIILMPIAKAGFFLKEYGPSAALIILVTDLTFGIVLGNFYSRLRRYSNQ